MSKTGALVSSIVLLLVGCATEAPPPKTSTNVAASPSISAAPIATTSASTSTAKPPAPACVPKGFVEGPLAAFQAKDGKLILCVAAPEDPGWVSCLSFDPKSGTYAAAPAFAPAAVPEEDWPFGLVTDGDQAKVCLSNAPTQCKVVKPGFKPAHTPEYEGAVSADGNQLFLFKYVAPAKKAPIVAQHKLLGEIFDVKTGKKTASFALPVGTPDKPQLFADQTDNWRARWYGPHLTVSAYRCCGPAGGQAFVEPKTGKVLSIGDPTLLLPLDADTFLVGNEDRWFDEKAGKIMGKTTLTVVDAKAFTSKVIPLPNAPRGEPETFVLGSAKIDDGKIALGYANPPGIVTFDPKTKSLGDAKPAPLCGP
jgi:hypothetical protein